MSISLFIRFDPGAAAIVVDGFEEALIEGVEGGFGLKGVLDGVGVGAVGVVFVDPEITCAGGSFIGAVLRDVLGLVEDVSHT